MNIIQIFQKFPDQAACFAYLEKVRWKGTPTCPYCRSTASSVSPRAFRWHCNLCNRGYSVTVGTIFHHTHLPLQKWLLAVSLVLNAKKGLSALQLSRDLEVNKNTAWRMGMKIREAMANQGELLNGLVEMDESYIGGAPKQRNRKYKGSNTNPVGRATKNRAVIAAAERGGSLVAQVMAPGQKLSAVNLDQFIKRNVKTETSTLITDKWRGYANVKNYMWHLEVDHSIAYSEGGMLHTNTVEGFWGIVRRGIVGQYHKVSAHYLSTYLAEFTYRYNCRKMDSQALFDMTIRRGVNV